MHDMSNTRKEIAARLGFAARFGRDYPSKVSETAGASGGTWSKKMARYGSKKAAVMTYTDGGQVGQVYQDPDNPRVFKAFDMGGRLLGEGSEMDMKRKVEAINASRPGAKVLFDTYTDMVNELRRFTADLANVQYDWYTAANTWLARKRTSGNKEIAVEANRAYDAVEREMQPRWRQSRPGAKASFAAHPSWSEGILGKDTDPKLAAYSWISKNNIESGRKQMLLADLAAGMYEKNPSMSIAQAVLAAAKDMVSKGVATRDIQQWAENGGKFARPGAKVEFTNIFGHDLAEETVALYEERLVSYRKALANADLLVKKANSLLRRDDQQASNEVVGIARIMESAMKSPRGFSRPGTKTRMTREQTEEQKAGLKIMSAADPAVGAKIATLIKEGKPQDQAVAIALDMKRRGEI